MPGVFYMRALTVPENFKAYRVSRGNLCPICEKPDWCLSDGKSWAICPRVESQQRWGEAGWLHRLGSNAGAHIGRGRVRRVEFGPAMPADKFDLLAKSFKRALDSEKLRVLAASLAVSSESLIRLRVGWAEKSAAWAFPMSDVEGRIRGIRLRSAKGRKFSIKGGQEGLFVPEGSLERGKVLGELLICEGPTDTAALLDLGFCTVGRPNCGGGSRLLINLLKKCRPRKVVIVADGDEAGRRGSETLAGALLPYAPTLSVLTPPHGIKDARAWKQAGAGAIDIQKRIRFIPKLGLSIQSRRICR